MSFKPDSTQGANGSSGQISFSPEPSSYGGGSTSFSPNALQLHNSGHAVACCSSHTSFSPMGMGAIGGIRPMGNMGGLGAIGSFGSIGGMPHMMGKGVPGGANEAAFRAALMSSMA